MPSKAASLRRIGLTALLMLGVLNACSTPPPTVSTPMSQNVTLVTTALATLPDNRPTLPPSWTPLPTLTPPPPATLTPMPSPGPTLSAADICAVFSLLSAPQNGVELDYDGTVTFAWRGVPSGESLRLTIHLHDQKAGINIDTPTPGDMIVPIPLLRLPDAGQYDWTLALHDPRYGDICAQSGSFTRKALIMM